MRIVKLLMMNIVILGGYHHYLAHFPSYGGNVLDIGVDPFGSMYACMYVGIYVSKYACICKQTISMTFVFYF